MKSHRKFPLSLLTLPLLCLLALGLATVAAPNPAPVALRTDVDPVKDAVHPNLDPDGELPGKAA